MAIYLVISGYFNNGILGVYTNVKRARIALEYFLKHDNHIAAFRDLNDYAYKVITKNEEAFIVEIKFNLLDAEFVGGICKKD